MDEAGVLACPAEAGGYGERSLDDGAGIDVGARFELAEAFAESCVERLEPPEQNLVVIAGAALAFFVYAR